MGSIRNRVRFSWNSMGPTRTQTPTPTRTSSPTSARGSSRGCLCLYRLLPDAELKKICEVCSKLINIHHFKSNKYSKIFWSRGTTPSSDPSLGEEGATPSPHPRALGAFGVSILSTSAMLQFSAPIPSHCFRPHRPMGVNRDASPL